MIVQVPAVSRVISKPLTVQTAWVVEVRVTGRPELAVGLTVSGDWSRFAFAGLENVIVCETWVTVNERGTGFAGR